MEKDFVKMIKDADHQTMQHQPKVGYFVVGICPFCNNKVLADEFHTKSNLKKFKISGLCQRCQDGTLKEGK